MSDEIPPALTPEEWAYLLNGVSFTNTRGDDIVDAGSFAERRVYAPFLNTLSAHGEAAVALYGQPAGFTREDVDELRQLSKRETCWWQDNQILASLADRLAALLPPPERTPLLRTRQQ